MVELLSDAVKIVVNAKPTALSVMVDNRDVFTFDTVGRLWSALMDGSFFRRGMDNRVLEKRRVSSRRLGYEYRRLPDVESWEVIEEVCARMTKIYDAVAEGKASVVSPRDNAEQALREAERTLERIVRYDFDALEFDRLRFLSLYRPINILPPDQYLAIVLQATEGCHYNRCAFCTFYRGTRFRIKTAEEFRQHVREVKHYFGDALAMRHNVFLSDANALVTPQPRLLEFFDIIHEELPMSRRNYEAGDNGMGPHRPGQFDGIYAFLDLFSGQKKTWRDYAALRGWGLKRVYIGLETGDDELLRFLNKPATSEEARDIVMHLKRAGVSVGVIVLLGVGGDRFARQHVERTTQVLNSLPLDEDDFIYLSPLVEQEDWDYGRRMAKEGVRPLSDEQVCAQMEQIRGGLRFAENDESPRVSVYDIREFVY
jgi:radical SAM superfamily enzyme YgiQ (UPF0313 family)